MLRKFRVQNFRGLRDLELEPLDRVNLFAGKNNVGKTALLEALWMHHGPDVPDLGARVDSFRGVNSMDSKEFLWDMFYHFDRESTIEFLSVGDHENDQRVLKIFLESRKTSGVPLAERTSGQIQFRQVGSAEGRTSDDEIVFEYTDENGGKHVSRAWLVEGFIAPNVWTQAIQRTQERAPRKRDAIFLPARFRSDPREDADRFSKLEIKGIHQKVVDILKEMEPNLVRLAVVVRQDTSAIYGDIGMDRLIPVALMGDGMVRLLSLAIAIASEPKGAVMVDEIENGLHHTIMPKVWKGIARFAREFDVQVFATTHSDECIRSAHNAFEQDVQYDFRLHRLDRRNGVIKAVTYDRETLATALASGLEVR